jgi:hypothetical protein
MRSVIFPAVVFFMFAFSVSCGKIEKLPPEPSIKFTSFEVFDSTESLLGNPGKAGILKFYFEDGDGDLGLAAHQSTNSDSTNLFLTLFRKTMGVYAQVPDNYGNGFISRLLSFRIPYMDRQGQDKMLRGNISITIFYMSYTSDTLKYSFFVKDRAEHSSDTVSTCDFVLTKNGICNN